MEVIEKRDEMLFMEYFPFRPRRKCCKSYIEKMNIMTGSKLSSLSIAWCS
jgi:hypothetical protein